MRDLRLRITALIENTKSEWWPWRRIWTSSQIQQCVLLYSRRFIDLVAGYRTMIVRFLDGAAANKEELRTRTDFALNCEIPFQSRRYEHISEFFETFSILGASYGLPVRFAALLGCSLISFAFRSWSEIWKQIPEFRTVLICVFVLGMTHNGWLPGCGYPHGMTQGLGSVVPVL
jgi:hypothetical protein